MQPHNHPMVVRVGCFINCGYEGPYAETESEAIRLHNLVCRSEAIAAVPVAELENLAEEWREAAAYIYDSSEAEESMEIAESSRMNQCYKELHALIERHRKP